MRALSGLLLRFVCSLALVLSALPIRAGVVCVVDQHVVAQCARACCPPKAKTRCEVAFRKAGTVVAPLKATNVLPPSLAPSVVPHVSAPIEAAMVVTRIVLDDEPVFSRPRPSDRGRAPPFPSRSPSSTTR